MTPLDQLIKPPAVVHQDIYSAIQAALEQFHVVDPTFQKMYPPPATGYAIDDGMKVAVEKKTDSSTMYTYKFDEA
jgi:hypothetical protein